MDQADVSFGDDKNCSDLPLEVHLVSPNRSNLYKIEMNKHLDGSCDPVRIYFEYIHTLGAETKCTLCLKNLDNDGDVNCTIINPKYSPIKKTYEFYYDMSSDGNYQCHIELTDNNGRKANSEPFNISITPILLIGPDDEFLHSMSVNSDNQERTSIYLSFLRL